MDKIIEAIEFIESKTMRKYLNGLYASGNLSLSNEDMLAIVWNMKGDIDMKQAFLMSFTDDDRAGKCAVELVKRIEAFRSFIKENHDDLVYVLTMNDKFYGVYNRFDVARDDYKEVWGDEGLFNDMILEIYDPKGSMFKGRIFINKSFDVLGFDLGLDVINDNKLWERGETDDIINHYVDIPCPFSIGEKVTLPSSLDCFEIFEIPGNDDSREKLFTDLTVKAYICDDDDVATEEEVELDLLTIEKSNI